MDATVVIPTHNRRAVLAHTLEALARADYPSDRWEIVVVDDGSEDGSAGMVRDAAYRGLPVTCIEQTARGPAAARNRGARAARGDYLVFLDDDIVVQPDFVARHVSTLRENPGCWVLGRVVQREEMRLTPFGRYRHALWESFHEAHPSDRVSETAGAGAANLSLPRADFVRFDGFDEEIRLASCEDLLLAIRARKEGIRMLYDPRIVGVHNDWAITLERFCERQRLYAISDVVLWRKLGEDSPRRAVVVENGSVRWLREPVRLSAKKTAKAVLATRPLRRWLLGVSRIAEAASADSRLSHALYRLAIAVATFRGVRQGLRGYSGQ